MEKQSITKERKLERLECGVRTCSKFETASTVSNCNLPLKIPASASHEEGNIWSVVIK